MLPANNGERLAKDDCLDGFLPCPGQQPLDGPPGYPHPLPRLFLAEIFSITEEHCLDFITEQDDLLQVTQGCSRRLVHFFSPFPEWTAAIARFFHTWTHLIYPAPLMSFSYAEENGGFIAAPDYGAFNDCSHGQNHDQSNCPER